MPHPARRPCRAGLGQCPAAPGPSAARVHRRECRLAHHLPIAHLCTRPQPGRGIWSLVKRDIGNLAAADLAEVARAVKRRLKKLKL